MMKRIVLILSFLGFFSIKLLSVETTDTLQFVYKLHGQTRKFQYVFVPERDGALTLHWGIERNLKWWSGTYHMTHAGIKRGNSLSFRMPEDGNHVKLADNETFALISNEAYHNLKDTGKFTYDGVDYNFIDNKTSTPIGNLLHVIDSEGAELWILDKERFPIIWEMRNNPLEINWTTQIINR